MQDNDKLIKSIMDLGLNRKPSVLRDKPSEPQIDPLNRFKQVMSFLESSFNTNTNHRPITTGLQAGTTAQGRTGLMPRTVKEFANRRKLAGNLDDLDQSILKASDLEVQEMLKTNPELYDRYEDELARFVLDKSGGDMGLAATKWLHGHNRNLEGTKRIWEKSPQYRKRFQEAKRLVLEKEKRDQELLEQTPITLRNP